MSRRYSLLVTLRSRCDVLVMPQLRMNESYDTKDRFYEERERVFDQFLKYHLKLLFGDFTVKWG